MNDSINKYELFKYYMDIDDLKIELKKSNLKRRIKIFFFMSIFNFILLYKFFRNKPLK